MKTKRIVFIIVLTIIFVLCFQSMNTRYNPLARYSYNDQLSSEEKELIIQHMNNEDIDYMIQAKLKPEQYLKYIEIEGFSVKNTLYYEKCEEIQKADIEYIIHFVNTYKKKLSYKTLDRLISSYSYATLEEFFNGAYPYDKEAILIKDPQNIHTMIQNGQTVYKYVPKNLVNIDRSIVPIASLTNHENLQIQEEVIEPLKALCNALSLEMKETSGGLILTSAYVSYEDQIHLYEEALLKYGIDNVHYYEDKPGQSEHQLGYTLRFHIASLSEEEIIESEQVKWLNEHAREYGFIIRYPKEAEAKTGKFYQPLTLRYVGDKTLEEDFDFIAFLSGDK